MKALFARIFPENANGDYNGSRIAYWFFACYSVVSMIRSLIHVFAPDGGANSIAGLDLTVGAENVIFAFGLWGVIQVLFALLQLLVTIRYKTLIPLFTLLLILEILGRMLVGAMHPPVLFHTPPGAFANYILLPVAALMLVLSLRQRKSLAPKESR